MRVDQINESLTSVTTGTDKSNLGRLSVGTFFQRGVGVGGITLTPLRPGVNSLFGKR